MANKIKPRRSYTANAVPTTSDLDTHELAINWQDGKAFTKNASGQIVSVTLGGGGGSANIVEATTVAGFPTTGSAGTLYHATNVRRIFFWDSSGVYVEAGPSGGGGGSGSLSGSVTIPGMGDPSYASVSLLLHGNGSTTDSGPAARTGTATNVATNGAAKFGSSSLVFDGTSRLVYASNSAWNFPGDFTIEAWIYLTAAIGSGSYSEYALAAQWSGTGGLAWLWYLKGDGFSFTTGNGSAVAGYDNRGSVSITANQWHHVAITRSGSTFSSYLNGSRFGTFSSSIDMSGNGVLSIGDQGDGVIRPFYGRIDEFRITKGVARYTGDSYTVPTAAFPDYKDLTLPVVFS
jgi:hypothetical protein